MSVFVGKLVQTWFVVSYTVIYGIIRSLQILLKFTIEPFNKRICRKLEKYFFLPTFQYLVFLLDWWSEIRLILYADGEAKDNLFGKENAMCFMNTQDNFLQQIIMAKLGDIFNMSQSCDNNVFQLNASSQTKSNKYRTYRQIAGSQYWCVLFPKNESAVSNCKDCGDFNQMAAPCFSTFQSVQKSQEDFDAIYDISIVVTGDWTEITPRHIFDKEPIDVHVYLKRIPIDEMPENESDQKVFLEELNQEKNFSMHQFLANGEFLECQTGINIIEQHEFEPSVRSAVSFGVCSVFTLLIFASVIFVL